jgi:hypothetical protein
MVEHLTIGANQIPPRGCRRRHAGRCAFLFSRPARPGRSTDDKNT